METNPIIDCEGLPRDYVDMVGCVLERTRHHEEDRRNTANQSDSLPGRQDRIPTDDLDSGEMDPSSVSDKASSTGTETPVLEILAAVGVLALILSILIAVGLYIRKRSD